jgi:hypothetical protein
MTMMRAFTILAFWRDRKPSGESRVSWPEERVKRRREPRAGDRWVDGSGRVHVLAVLDEDGRVTTGDVSL